MRTSVFLFTAILLVCSITQSEAQSRNNDGNVGIGTSDPREPLEVAGIVYSSLDGFMFPDGSVQTSAYNSHSASDAGENRWFLIMEATNIQGSFNFPPDHMDAVKVIEFSWGMYHPFDEATGNISGSKRHNLITIKKDIDKSSTQFANCFINSTLINEVDVYFYREDTISQQLDWYYKIHFDDVHVAALYQSEIYKGQENFSHIEELHLMFHQFTMEWRDGGLNANGYWYGNPF